MKRHTFLIGLADKDTKQQELSREVYLRTIYNVVGDCTISDAVGYYTHDNGELVEEPSLRVDMLFKNDNNIRGYADRLKAELNQESIGYEVAEVELDLL